MGRVLNPILVCGYLLIAAVPLAGTVAGTPGVTLNGTLPAIARPGLSWSTFASEDYQKQITQWFEQSLGFRGVSVHADNTVLFHAFHETKPGLGVMIGQKNTLFEQDDVGTWSARSEDLPQPAAVEAYADKLAEVQRRLASHGRALVPLIIPSKMSLYAAELPVAWQHAVGAEPRPYERSVYLTYKRAFTARGMRFTDVRQVFASSGEPREVLWGAEARHWSRYAACLAMRDILAQSALLTGKPSTEYPCVLDRQPIDVDRVDETTGDFDLLRLLNAWFLTPESRVALMTAAPGTAGKATTKPKPSALFVGTSFMDTIARGAQRSGAFSEVHLFWYNTSYRDPFPDGREFRVVPHSEEWRRVVNRDVIVYDLFEPYISPTNVIADFLEALRLEEESSDSRK